MTKKMYYLLILFLPFISLSALDTLEVLQEFDPPTPEPRALEFDGTQFWVGSLHSPALYRRDKDFQVVDTVVTLPFARIAGITFKDGKTWIARDSAVAESLVINSNVDSVYYNVYCIYGLSENNSLSDSIRIKASAANATDTNHLWGLTFLNNHFYVSYNGGWGPCIYKVNPVTKEVTTLMGHASGMSAINDEWWCVGGVGNDPFGSYLMTMDESGTETIRYKVLFSHVDLTFDGSNFWLFDLKNSRICKMKGTGVSVKEKPALEGSISLKQKGRKIVIQFPGTEIKNIYVYNLNGRLVKKLADTKSGIIEWSGTDNNNKPVSNGCYVMQIQINVNFYSRHFILSR